MQVRRHAGAFGRRWRSLVQFVTPVPPKPKLRIPSRYYPIHSYVACPSPKEIVTARWCLDMPCTGYRADNRILENLAFAAVPHQGAGA